MGGSERRFVEEAFESNWIAPLGPNVDGFEQDLSQFTGSPHVAALTTGTAAIHLALILSGVKPGEEVICQSFTFSASANPITYLGAKPVFVDSEELTWNMDPDLLEETIRERIKSSGRAPAAIIPVHLYGMPAQMQHIMDIAERHGIPVIEDAAEALGSHIDGKMCGTFGNYGILSFNGNKIITTSGGGALLSSDESQVQKARFLATQARDAAPHYEHSHVGYNYRLSNISAGIGRGQMQVLPDRIKKRREIFGYYRNALEASGFTFLDEPSGYYANRWLTTVLVNPEKTNGKTREDFRIALEKENIEARPLWKPMHRQPVFRDSVFYGNGVSDRLFENGLCLPSGTSMSDDELQRVLDVICSVQG
jgi:dTDP-4-amino-4,6-dideoxygalactose transaminase